METPPTQPRVLTLSADPPAKMEQALYMIDGDGDTTAMRKQRRNARDRKRSQQKKDTMETMRLQVKRLEAEKQRLEQRFPLLNDSPSSSPISSSSSSSDASDRLQLAQSQYRDVLAQIEKLRQANRAMALDILERDLFRSAAQNLLDSLHTDDDGSATSTSASSSTPSSYSVYSLASPPMPSADAVAFANKVTRQIGCARLESARMPPFSGARVFGWSDFRIQTGSSIKFTIQKSLPNQSAALLAERMWRILSDASQLKHLLPPGLQCDLRHVQRVGDHALVLDRVTKSRVFDELSHNALRTTMMLVRAAEDEAEPGEGQGFRIGMKTIDLPVFKAALAENEAWCDIFYWFHFQDVPSTGSTTVMFGGSLSYLAEAYARTWLAELVFLAIRWESLAVAPVLLRHEDAA